MFFYGGTIVFLGLGCLSYQVEKWLANPSSRNLDTALCFNLDGHGYKVFCSTLPCAIWRGLWFAAENENAMIQEYESNNEEVNRSIFLPTLMLCALWSIHAHFRRMWSVLWSSKVNVDKDIPFMRSHAESAATCVRLLTPGLVCDLCMKLK